MHGLMEPSSLACGEATPPPLFTNNVRRELHKRGRLILSDSDILFWTQHQYTSMAQPKKIEYICRVASSAHLSSDCPLSRCPDDVEASHQATFKTGPIHLSRTSTPPSRSHSEGATTYTGDLYVWYKCYLRHEEAKERKSLFPHPAIF